MVTLILTHKEDGSPYWTDYFNTLDQCQAWLIQEKTRPYWKDFRVEIIDTTKEQEAIKALAKAEAERKHQELKELKEKPNKSQKDLEDLVNKLYEVIIVR